MFADLPPGSGFRFDAFCEFLFMSFQASGVVAEHNKTFGINLSTVVYDTARCGAENAFWIDGYRRIFFFFDFFHSCIEGLCLE